MNYKHIFLCLLLATCLFSCTEKDYSAYPPTWYGFTYKVCSPPDYNYVQYPGYIQGKPIVLCPGESIHITAHQDQRGRYINATDYTWTICYDTLNTRDNDDPTDDVVVHATKTYPQHTNYDGYAAGYDNKGNAIGPADPVCYLLLPESALPTEGNPDTIKFNAKYKYSTGQGAIYETGSIVANTSVNGRIIPQSNSQDGGAVGYIYFTVPKKN